MIPLEKSIASLITHLKTMQIFKNYIYTCFLVYLFSRGEFLKSINTAHLPTYASPQFMIIVNCDKICIMCQVLS